MKGLQAEVENRRTSLDLCGHVWACVWSWFHTLLSMLCDQALDLQVLYQTSVNRLTALSISVNSHLLPLQFINFLNAIKT